MSEDIQYWIPPEQSGVPVDYNGTDLLAPYFTGPGELPYPSHSVAIMHNPIPDATPPGMIDDMALENYHLLSQELAEIQLAGITDHQFHLPFGGNEYLQPGNSPLLIPPSGATRPSTLSTTTIALSAQSPARPSEIRPHLLTDDIRTVGSPQIQLAARRRRKDGIYQCPFGSCIATFTSLHNLEYHRNSHLGLKPHKCSTCTYAAASPATLKRHQSRCTVSKYDPPEAVKQHPAATSGPIPVSPVRPSVTEPLVGNIEAAEDDPKAVGSLPIQQAVGKRRKKDGIHECPIRNGCNATFTTRHNLRYHVNAHHGLKPYKCAICAYVAASPATLKRHQATCKGTVSKDDLPEL